MAKSNLSFEIRDLIEQDIVTGHFQPGERLDEMLLSRRFNASRTPVREALRQLAASGVIDMQPNRGCFVRRLDASALIEMFEVMAELEALCSRLAARRATLEEVEALSALNDACVEANARQDPDAYYYANELFHRQIYTLSGNTFLAEEAHRLSTKLKPYRRLQLRMRNRIAASLREHLDILAAIRAGEPLEAAEAMRAHILVQGEKFTDFVAQLRNVPPE